MEELNCYLCNDSLTAENRSEEHIIPNSIGGILKSDKLICKTCNDITGYLFDSTFSKMGNIYSFKHSICKQRGENQSFISRDVESGRKVLINPDKSFKYIDPLVIRDNEKVNFSAGSKQRLLQEIERFKKMIAKNEQLVIEPIYEIYSGETIKAEHEIEVNHELLFRSVIKIMSNFYVYKTRDNNSLKKVVEFICNDIENLFCWFCDLEVCKNLHQSQPYHVLIIKGDKKQKALYGYFEIFGQKGFIALLNGRYNQDDIQLEYTYDPITHNEIMHNYDFQISVGEIIQIIQQKPLADFKILI